MEQVIPEIWKELLAWWESLSGDEQTLVPVIVTIVAVILPVLISLISRSKFTKSTITQNTDSGTANVHMGTGDIHAHVIYIENNGITPEEYRQGLKERETEIRAELEASHAKDCHVLVAELNATEQKLLNIQASYKAYIADLKERVAQLEKLRGEFPDRQLDHVIEALQQGESDKAAQLFKQIEEEGEGHIKQIAEAAFQRGKIAESEIQYTDAREHYEKAVRLQPDNVLYLNEAGVLHLDLANHKKAIDYFERALTSDLKTYGANHPEGCHTSKQPGHSMVSIGRTPQSR